ncbi:MAG TPA: hypothetical protein VFT94_03700 [Gaiellaceae bacterium]|nr:hypothetical protein [Gaiellaceae bacterium]
MRRLLLTVVLAPLVLAGTALADAPTKTTISSGPDTFVVGDLCSFPISITDSRTVTTITFDNGDVQRHVRVDATLSANGKTVSENDSINVYIDADSPTVRTIIGAFTRISVPGAGILVLEAGRIVFDVATGAMLFEAGQHDFTFDGEIAALCGFLSPTT